MLHRTRQHVTGMLNHACLNMAQHTQEFKVTEKCHDRITACCTDQQHS